jgi:hypothetical protein
MPQLRTWKRTRLDMVPSAQSSPADVTACPLMARKGLASSAVGSYRRSPASTAAAYAPALVYQDGVARLCSGTGLAGSARRHGNP